MGRCDQHGAGAGECVEVGHAQALVVDTDRHWLEPCVTDGRRQPGPSRILHCHRPVPG
jgi:hypothetical protein